MQTGPATWGDLPDYVYANDDALDVTDPTGRAGVPTGCASGRYVGISIGPQARASLLLARDA